MKPKSIGDITIARMVDKESTEHRYQNWFPDLPQEVFDSQRDWMDPYFSTTTKARSSSVITASS